MRPEVGSISSATCSAHNRHDWNPAGRLSVCRDTKCATYSLMF